MSEIEPLDSPNRPASVPRRFGVGVLLILMTAFAILFSLLSYLGAHPVFFIVISVTVCAVSIGQILLFEGKCPRTASMVVGTPCLTLLIAGLIVFSGPYHHIPFKMFFFTVGVSASFAAVLSLPLSYMAGSLVSGVFLVVELMFHKRAPLPRVELLPFTAGDFVVLQNWLKLEPLCLAWTRGRHASFADSAALWNYLNLPTEQSDDAVRLCLKAIAFYQHKFETASEDDDLAPQDAPILDHDKWCDERTIGYVELTEIDRVRRIARIDRPIVDPDAPQRPDVSFLMLEALLKMIRGPLGLRRLIVSVPHKHVIERDCCVQLALRYPDAIPFVKGVS